MNALKLVALVLLATTIPVLADVKLAELKVGNDVYTNVTVTTVTATDIFFQHAKGFGNAKLKNLDPELQKQFNYNPDKAGEIQKQQAEASAQYHKQAASAPRPVPASVINDSEPASAADDNADVLAPRISAKSFRGQPAPPLTVEKWLSPQPNTTGKFILVDFWATWCGPCRQSIPHLNALQEKFKDDLVVIGLSDEPEQTVRSMKQPVMNYAVAIDTKGRMYKTVEVKGIPHAMVIDPQGIVRFEGHPGYLKEADLPRLIAKYGR